VNFEGLGSFANGLQVVGLNPDGSFANTSTIIEAAGAEGGGFAILTDGPHVYYASNGNNSVAPALFVFDTSVTTAAAGPFCANPILSTTGSTATPRSFTTSSSSMTSTTATSGDVTFGPSPVNVVALVALLSAAFL